LLLQIYTIPLSVVVGALAERKVPGKAIAMAKNKVFIYYLEEYFQKIGGGMASLPEHSF
jgi:hypothetical protein